MKCPITKPPALLFLCLYPPPLKLQVIISFFLTPLLFSFLSLVCFCSSRPSLFWSPGSLVILVVSPCLPHSRVLFCSGVTCAVSAPYITPLMGSLFMSAFSIWFAKTTIKQTNNRSCCSWKRNEKNIPSLSLICKIEKKIKSDFSGQRFCRFTDLQKGRVLVRLQLPTSFQRDVERNAANWQRSEMTHVSISF